MMPPSAPAQNPVSSVPARLRLWIQDVPVECRDGDIIGRRGTVASAALNEFAILSRRHLQLHFNPTEGWSVRLLPEARNATTLDGHPLPKDAPRPLGLGEHHVEIENFVLRLEVDREAPHAVPPPKPRAPAAAAPAAVAVAVDDPSASAGGGQTRIPAADLDRVHTEFGGSDGLLRLIANHVADLIAIVDASGRRVWNNAAYFTCLGYPPDDPLRANSTAALHPEDLPLVKAVFEESMRTGVGRRIEYRMRHRHGHWVHLESQAQVVEGARSGGRYLLLVARDITERKDAEQKARLRGRQLSERTAALAALSQSSIFQNGELERCYAALTEAAVQHLDCERAGVWMVSPGQAELECREVFDWESKDHDRGESLPAGASAGLLAAMHAERLLVAENALEDARLSPLRNAGYLTKNRVGALLIARVRSGEEAAGLLLAERHAGGRRWELEEENFAANLADLLQMALEANKRAEAFRALQESQRRLAEELAEAAGYVRALLPSPISGAVETEWRFVPSEQLGGDAFGHHWLDGEHLAIYLLDVVGHGVGAALLSISAVNVLRSGALPDTDFRDPAAVLRALNRAFQMDRHNNMFFTVWYGVFHRPTRELLYAAAGHPPAIVLDGSGPELGKPVGLSTPGLMIGAVETPDYASARHVLAPHSRLYLFSDGVFEVARPDGTPWGFDSFTGLLGRPPLPGLTELDSLRRHAEEIQGETSLPDDFSIIRFTFH